MLDIAATIKWLTSRGVKVLGSVRDVCDGYVFVGEKVKLCGKLTSSISISEKMLILNGISPDKRIQDREILAQARSKGSRGQSQRPVLPPAVNAAFR